MKKLTNRQRRATALLLITLTCGTALSACSDKTQEPTALPAQTAAPATEAAKEITAGSIRCDASVRELTLANPQPEELNQLLPQLSQLETLTLEGTLPDAEALRMLREQFPQVSFVYQVDLCTMTFSSDTVHLDLTDVDVTAQELTDRLPLFSQLQELTLTGTGLSDEEKMALADSLPGVLVRCELPLAGGRYLTDSTEIDLSGMFPGEELQVRCLTKDETPDFRDGVLRYSIDTKEMRVYWIAPTAASLTKKWTS